MRISVESGPDLDVTPHACAHHLSTYLDHSGETSHLWVGDVELHPDHPAGVAPLVHGAVVRTRPGAVTAPPQGAWLDVIAGPDAGHVIPLRFTQAITVGRDPRCDLALADAALSRHHATIEPTSPPRIREHHSTNGTWVWRGTHRRRVRGVMAVHPGDVVCAGASVLRIGPTPAPSQDDPQPHTVGAGRVAGMGGGAMAAITMAAVTGRWYFALLALVYPAIAAYPVLRARLSSTGEGTEPFFADLPQVSGMDAGLGGLPHGTIAVVGATDAARALARALVLAQRTRPAQEDWHEPWMRWLMPPDPRRRVVLVPSGDSPPSWAAAVARVDAEGVTFTHDTTVRWPPIAVSAATADLAARRMAARRERTELPTVARWADLTNGPRETPTGHGKRQMRTTIGVGLEGPFTLDLDRHGPHLLVAGTTGAGKSAFLETLVLGLAHSHGPQDLALALIDFKGGAGLRACMDLPHVAGVLTDLDPHLAHRALAALAREIEDRKSALAAAECTSFTEWEGRGGAPPRLVVVADEYQEVTAHYREFLPDLSRLAAQGRSLGVHLVLATQRPAGAVTPEVRANVGTTIALRVASDAESRDLMGTGDAATLPRDAPGRAFVVHGATHTPVQIALPIATPTPLITPADSPADVASRDLLTHAVHTRWSDATPASPLWLPPLPSTANVLRDHPEIVLGLGDWPAERRQGPIPWDLSRGPVVVAGPAGSGRTTALAAISAQASTQGLRPVWLPEDAREAARTVELAAAHPRTLLIIDDAVAGLARLGEVDRAHSLDTLSMMLTRGVPVAMAFPLAGHHRLAAHAGTRVILTGGEPADEAMWSVPRSLQGLAALPGRARIGSQNHWCEAQVVSGMPPADQPLVTSLPSTVTCDHAGAWPPLTLGIGGDSARPVPLPRGEAITVLGPPGATRQAVQRRLRALGVEAHSITTADSALLLPGARVADPVVIVAEPHARTAQELGRGELWGLIDPTPVPLRAVLIDARGSCAVQFPGVAGSSEG
ncbi:MAG: FtsK/SpoIIIE domain-containing protein [Demequina sp.]